MATRLTAAEKPKLKKCRVCEKRATCRPMNIPSIDTIMRWEWDKGGCKAVDGCWIEPDGHCQHGCPSWMLVLHLI